MATLTLDQTLRLLIAIFGTRNQRLLRRTTDRVALLLRSVHRLEAIHRKFAVPVYSQPLASIFSKIVAVVDVEDGVGREKFLEAIKRKYGAACVYCHKIPCACPTHGPRPEATLSETELRNLTLGDLQRHLYLLYGAKNATLSPEALILRLFTEVAEISTELLMHDSGEEKIPPSYYEEAADAFAWLIALANYFGVDLQSAINTLYLNGCHVCGYFPCQCRDIAETVTLT